MVRTLCSAAVLQFFNALCSPALVEVRAVPALHRCLHVAAGRLNSILLCAAPSTCFVVSSSYRNLFRMNLLCIFH
jgi:hypothetical protein